MFEMLRRLFARRVEPEDPWAEERARFKATFPQAVDLPDLTDEPAPDRSSDPVGWLHWNIHAARRALSGTMTGEAKQILFDLKASLAELPPEILRSLPTDVGARVEQAWLLIWTIRYDESMDVLDQLAYDAEHLR
ncbi:MAG: hypothetical protein IT361_06210 [Gemmatimonadaceae bacterium]|nr:hypothetical protein [Gemmatimonadaceae bacterium]